MPPGAGRVDAARPLRFEPRRGRGIEAERVRELRQVDALRARHALVGAHDRESQSRRARSLRVRIGHAGHDLGQRARGSGSPAPRSASAPTSRACARIAARSSAVSVPSARAAEMVEAQRRSRSAGSSGRAAAEAAPGSGGSGGSPAGGGGAARGRRRRPVLARGRLVRAPGQAGGGEQRARVDERAAAAGQVPQRPAAPLAPSAERPLQQRADQPFRRHDAASLLSWGPRTLARASGGARQHRGPTMGIAGPPEEVSLRVAQAEALRVSASSWVSIPRR